MQLAELTEHVAATLRREAASLGLVAEDLRVTYVLNWGGFVAASFTATDGPRLLHLKLVRSESERSGLRRWQSLHEALEARYHAPQMIGWMEVEATSWGGPVFEHVAGRILDREAAGRLMPDILRLAGDLHRDRGLALATRRDDSPRTFLDCLRSRYVDMLREDLEIVTATRPPFIADATLAWMRFEVDRLDALAVESRSFEGPVESAIHWDLWWNNILVDAAGQWWLLDWDDLGPGDPALDYATVLWPLTQDGPDDAWRSFGIKPTDEHFASRMSIYRRAGTLDWSIDSLADWVDCDAVPEHRDRVREQKRRDHEHYLRVYRERYGQ
jgi:hypothetical protein